MKLKRFHPKKAAIALSASISLLAISATPSYAFDLGSVLDNFLGNFTDLLDDTFNDLKDLGDDLAKQARDALDGLLNEGIDSVADLTTMDEKAQEIASQNDENVIYSAEEVEWELTSAATDALTAQHLSAEGQKQKQAIAQNIDAIGADSESLATDAQSDVVSQDVLKKIATLMNENNQLTAQMAQDNLQEQTLQAYTLHHLNILNEQQEREAQAEMATKVRVNQMAAEAAFIAAESLETDSGNN